MNRVAQIHPLAVVGIAILCALSPISRAASADDPPDQTSIGGRYQWSQTFADRTKNRIFRDQVDPHWFGPNQGLFWYQVTTGPQSHEFKRVDAIAGVVKPAFDHHSLAKQLSEHAKTDANEHHLDLKNVRFDDDVSQMKFVWQNRKWQFTLPVGPLVEAGTSATRMLQALTSIRPSRQGGGATTIRFANQLSGPLKIKWIDFDGDARSYGTVAAGESVDFGTYAHHVWVLSDSSGDAVAAFVATDSVDSAIVNKNTAKPSPVAPQKKPRSASNHSPDGQSRLIFRDHNIRLVDQSDEDEVVITTDGTAEHYYGDDVWWSPDSSRFVAMRTKAGEHRKISMVRSSPEGSVHPVFETIPYEKPGDRRDVPRLYLFDKNSQWDPIPIDDALFANPFAISDLAWKKDGKSFSFLYNQRGHQRLALITVDAETKTPTVTIDETSDTFVCYSSKSFLKRLDDTNEIIWMSERSGWNHLYLIDQSTGEVKNGITSGSYVVRNVELVDEANRQIWLTVSGIDSDQDPYHKHLVRVGFDGSSLTRITDGDGDHQWSFSPDRKILIDQWSRVDMPPTTVLRIADTGATICELENADVSSLIETDWRMPERFDAKGRDGETDIHGIIVRPTNFDPMKSYPIVEQIYAGPHSSFVPKSFGLHRDLYEMAELGFIVVKIDGMGTSNRSKAFHDVCWKKLHDSGFADRIAWITAAAKHRPWMDLSRIGIYGGSAGGQSAMRALVDHGDFYRVAVADCGCHDNRVDKIWWNEQWMGWPVDEHYEASSNVKNAHRLQGDLLLIWGELDKNVDPSSSMQVVDALVRANKDFQMLCIPGAGHGAAGGPYAKRKQAEFLMHHLN